MNNYVEKFNIGQRVVCISKYLDYVVGDTYEVREHGSQGNDYGWNIVTSPGGQKQIVNRKTAAKHFELVGADTELDQLIETANKGLRALDKLKASFMDKLERLQDGNSTARPWTNGAQYRCQLRKKSTKKFVPFQVSNSWTVSLVDKQFLGIGCKIFGLNAVKTALHNLLNINASTSAGEFSASRLGIMYQGFCLPWADAEQILKAINDYEAQ